MIVDVLGKEEEELFQAFRAKIPLLSTQSGLNWGNLICGMKQDEAYFVVTKQNNEITGALPLYLFKNKWGNVLTSNPWNTISGIMFSKRSPSEQRQICKALLSYSLSLAQKMDCSTLTISTNPFLDDDDSLYSIIKPDYILENFVQYIAIDEVFDKNGVFSHPNYVKRTNLSRNLDKVSENGITISEEQRPEYIEEAFKLQEKRMSELGSCPYPRVFFDSALKNIAMKNEGKFLFAFYRGQMIATCFFLYNARLIDVYMLCMDSDFKQIAPNFALIKYLLQWAYKNKIQLVNWMSSPLRGEGVYKWKEQWGSKELTFRYLTKITGDISIWRTLSKQELARSYHFHYLMPFNMLNAKNGSNITTKDAVAVFIQSVHA
jgi:hypothetical protein